MAKLLFRVENSEFFFLSSPFGLSREIKEFRSNNLEGFLAYKVENTSVSLILNIIIFLFQSISGMDNQAI